MKRFSHWLPTLSMMLVSLISYVDRNTLALLAPTILRETHLTNEQYGWIISTFSIAYMIGNPVWGRALDRAGVRPGMTIAVALWTLASTAHAFAAGFWSFAVARAALGFCEGATFPGGLRTAVQTLKPSERSRGIAIAYSGGALGALFTPIIVTPVALKWGWRGAFWFTGLVGALWIAHWLIVSRRDDLRFTPPAPAESEASNLHWTDRRVWAFLAAYALGAMPLGFVLYQSAIYLNAAMGLSQATIGKLLWIPPLGWEIGYFFWGWRTDRMITSSLPRLTAYRRLLLTSLLLGLPLALIPWIDSLAAVMAILFVAMFTTAGFIIVPVSYATWVFSSRSSGLIAGLCAGSWSAAVALVMPLAGRLFDQHRYDAAFALAALFPVAGYTVWRLLARAAVAAAPRAPLES